MALRLNCFVEDRIVSVFPQMTQIDAEKIERSSKSSEPFKESELFVKTKPPAITKYVQNQTYIKLTTFSFL